LYRGFWQSCNLPFLRNEASDGRQQHSGAGSSALAGRAGAATSEQRERCN
jgi:hypothetical protein